jgi:hypothetical protein
MMARRKVNVKAHKRGRVTVKAHCRRPANRTIRPGTKRYHDLPF